MTMRPDKERMRTQRLNDLEYSSAKAQERTISDLWQRIREDLELLECDHITLHKDTSEVVEWLKQEAIDWQGIGDQIRQQESDSDDDC